MIPDEITIQLVEHELEGARAWGNRKGISFIWLPKDLLIRITMVQPSTEESFFLQGDIKKYKAVPPAWTFRNSDWCGEFEKKNYPAPSQTPWGSSIFHGKPVLCTPFNRLAYGENNGPHSDWGGATNWLSAGGNHIKAYTIGDMLQAIRRDFLLTKGRMK